MSRESSGYLKFLISDSCRAGEHVCAEFKLHMADSSVKLLFRSCFREHSLMATKGGDLQLIWSILVLDVAGACNTSKDMLRWF